MHGKLVISIDFEKYWGMQDFKTIENLEDRLKNVDKVVYSLLEKFDNNGIHATWAAVGFLFHSDKNELLKYLPDNKPSYKNESLSPYLYIQNSNLTPEDFHFAKDLIKKISETPFQEIASHTYSHYYCLEEGQTVEHFKADLAMFQNVSNLYDYQVDTIIFPRNLVNEEYLTALNDFNINIYRGNENHFIYQPTSNKFVIPIKRGLRLLDRYINVTGHHTYKFGKDKTPYNIPASRYFAPYMRRLRFLEPLRINRIKTSMTYAARKGDIFHLWLHPHDFGINYPENMKAVDEILAHYKALVKEYGMESYNMKEVVFSPLNIENSN